MSAAVLRGIAGAVSHSSGHNPPATALPAGACDAHLHILDPHFAAAGALIPAGMTLADYRGLQRRTGLQRAVIVQAKPHGTDHRCLFDAISRFEGKARGIAVVAPSINDEALEQFAASGIVGLRFSVWNRADTITTIAMIEPLAQRIAPLGWHVQIHMLADQIVDHQAVLERLPCPIVFDHMGRLPPAEGADHPAFGVIAGLVERGRTWVKLSGAYLNSAIGAPDYPDAAGMARAYVRLAPERLVWGSDWPHTTEPVNHKPDDAQLLDLLAGWAGSDTVSRRILVENPAELYRF